MMKNSKLIYILISILYVLIILIYFFDMHVKSFKPLDFFSLAGILITSIAFVVGCYFAILAISAYSHLRDIEKIKFEVNNISVEIIDQLKSYHDKFRNIENTASKGARQTVEMLYDFVCHQILLCELGYPFPSPNKALSLYLAKRKNRLYRFRSKLALDYPVMQKDLRLQLIREFGAVGELEDLISLERALLNPEEAEEVKLLIKDVIAYIKNEEVCEVRG